MTYLGVNGDESRGCVPPSAQVFPVGRRMLVLGGPSILLHKAAKNVIVLPGIIGSFTMLANSSKPITHTYSVRLGTVCGK